MRRSPLALGLVSLGSLSLGLGIASCGSGGTTGAGGSQPTSSVSTSAGGRGGASASTGGTGGDEFIDSGPGCKEGDPCGDGGVCTNGACCDTGVTCAGQCCDAGKVCSFQKCEAPGADCVDADDCAPGSYCDYSSARRRPSATADRARAAPHRRRANAS